MLEESDNADDCKDDCKSRGPSLKERKEGSGQAETFVSFRGALDICINGVSKFREHFLLCVYDYP